MRWSEAYYRELGERLRALLPAATRLLPSETVRWFGEFLDHGEYGLAVEIAAEGLPTAASPEVRELAGALLAEARVMEMTEPAVDRLRELAGVRR